MTKRCESDAVGAGALARELRDGLLQDLLAVSMLIEGARARAEERDTTTTHELLGEAETTVREDVRAVRALITRLGGTQRTTTPDRTRGT
jgi:signal transduction histidine kinase